jgi:hypothetical protein
MSFETRLEELRNNIKPLQRFLHLFESSLDDPIFQTSENLHAFRYKAPDVRHFCLLKGIRAISAFNAAIELCRLGFSQEICVLLRTIVECTSHVDYVLANEGPVTEKANEFISNYFFDVERGPSPAFKRSGLRQREIHAAVGEALEKFIGSSGSSGEYTGVNTSKLYSSVYLNLSNYVHCKYPETMDLYGGRPGKFHLKGMGGTPKDFENINLLETYFVSVSQCLQLVVLRLNLLKLITESGDQGLEEWIRSRP